MQLSFCLTILNYSFWYLPLIYLLLGLLSLFFRVPSTIFGGEDRICVIWSNRWNKLIISIIVLLTVPILLSPEDCPPLDENYPTYYEKSRFNRGRVVWQLYAVNSSLKLRFEIFRLLRRMLVAWTLIRYYANLVATSTSRMASTQLQLKYR